MCPLFWVIPFLPFSRPIPDFYTDIPDFYTEIPYYYFLRVLPHAWYTNGGGDGVGVGLGPLGGVEELLASYTLYEGDV